MLNQHKLIIKTFIDEDIDTINMYWGYRGDFILKLVLSSVSLVDEIEAFCKANDIEVVVKSQISTKNFAIFCIVVDEDVYKLKS